MNNFEKFTNGLPQQPSQAKTELFEPNFQAEYELARRVGDERFGSECRHENIKNGHCEKCLRKVWNGKITV